MKHLAKLSAITVLFIAIGLTTGCGSKPAPDTQRPVQPTIGIADIAKVMTAHHQYTQLKQLGQEYNALAAAVNAEKAQSGQNSLELPSSAAGQRDAAAQEFSIKMAAKERELNAGLEAAAGEVKQTLANELAEYTRGLDTDYEPAIFSRQLKLKTVQLSKDEMAAVQADIDTSRKGRKKSLPNKRS